MEFALEMGQLFASVLTGYMEFSLEMGGVGNEGNTKVKIVSDSRSAISHSHATRAIQEHLPCFGSKPL
jgi:hypothetical protein